MAEKRQEKWRHRICSFFINSTTNSDYLKYDFDKYFREILYIIDISINRGFGWVIWTAEAESANISVYSPLSERTYFKLSKKLKKSTAINVSFGVIRDFKSIKTYPEWIAKSR